MWKTAVGFCVVMLACVLLAATIGHDARADSTADLFVVPDSLWVVEESIFVLGIAVSDETTSLMGYNVAVTFDKTVIRILGANEGPLPIGSGYATFFYWLNPSANADSVHVHGAILGHTVDGPGTLFALTFEALDAGEDRETDIRIVFGNLRDGVNRNIPHTTTGGWVKVLVTVPVEHSTWGAIKNLYQ